MAVDATGTPGDRMADDGTLSPEEWRTLKAEWTHDEGLRRLEDRGVRYEDEAERSLDLARSRVRDPLRQAMGIRVRPGEDNPLAFRDDRSFDILDATGKIGHLTGYLGGPWSDAERDTEFRVTHVEISEPGRTLSPDEWKQVLHGLREHLPEVAELVGGNRGGEGGELHPASEKLFRLPPPAVRDTTRNLVESLMFDVWPRAGAIVDFGLKTQEHYEALYYPVRGGEITPEQLDTALGDGEKLTALARSARSNPHREIAFRTDWDDLRPEPESEGVSPADLVERAGPPSPRGHIPRQKL